MQASQRKADIGKRTIVIGLGAVLVLPLVAAPVILAPSRETAPFVPAVPVESAEQARAIEAMRPTKPGRPTIAVVALNEGTEVSDFLVAYGVLKHADVADVTAVAEKPGPVRLYPSLSIDPEATMRAFDERRPGGADYVVVPAMEPPDDPVVRAWITAQHRKGARIVSICNGSRTLAAAGLLDGRRATAHWYSRRELQKKHPALQWVPDRRYVTDNGITTSTGITANVPVMMALVEAIGGRETAARVAGELGVANWDARHRSSEFRLTSEHRKTFVRNTLSFWRHETIGLPVVPEADEIALGLTVDAWSRTRLVTLATVGRNGAAVRSRHGLMIRPDRSSGAAVDEMLAPPSSEAPAMTLERELPRIAARYDRHTAAIVALTMEYPWVPDRAQASRQE